MGWEGCCAVSCNEVAGKPPCPQFSPESPDLREAVDLQYPKFILVDKEHRVGKEHRLCR